jgi:hypothetical protein
MSADAVLQRVDKVRRTGPGKWVACCPAHEDRAPSLAIRETDDGRLLLHCFAGCSADSVIGALGLQWSDLMPPLPDGVHHLPRVRKPWSVGDALELIDQEATLLAVILADAAKRGALPATIKDRALRATGRLTHVVEVLRAR